MDTLVYVFGNDHSNTVSVIQSLGRAGYYVTAILFGKRTGMVKSSRYTKDIISGNSAEDCIKRIQEKNLSEGRVPIIPCCDEAAKVLDRYYSELNRNFVFQHTNNNLNFDQIQDKSFQVGIARESGLLVPESIVLEGFNTKGNICEVTVDKYPVIIKPLISHKGAKSDIRVCRNEKELLSNLQSLSFTKQVLLQHYIEKAYDMLLYGCAKINGDVIFPAFIVKERLYPPKTGLGIINRVEPIDKLDAEFLKSCKRFVQKLEYVGLFSMEFAFSSTENQYYFIEANFRNDGTNAAYTKSGANLPAIHVKDLKGEKAYNTCEIKPMNVVFEMNLFMSFFKRQTSVVQLFKDLKKCNASKLYYSEDMKPFFKQFVNLLLEKMHLNKNVEY